MPILAKYIMIFLSSEVTDDVSGKAVGTLADCWMRNFLAGESCILPIWRGRRATEDNSRQCYLWMTVSLENVSQPVWSKCQWQDRADCHSSCLSIQQTFGLRE